MLGTEGGEMTERTEGGTCHNDKPGHWGEQKEGG